MKLNWIERMLVNNPVREWLQWNYEAGLLSRLGGDVAGERVLEIGCGRGVGTEIIIEKFGAAQVTAFDLDPKMVELARRRLARFDGRVTVAEGDATRIAAEGNTFDAVFDFGIIHHVPIWQDAVREVARVLRPGGRFFFEEVTKHALDRWFYRTFLVHPSENRFTGTQFVRALEQAQIHMADRVVQRFFGDFVIGVGTKEGTGT